MYLSVCPLRSTLLVVSRITLSSYSTQRPSPTSMARPPLPWSTCLQLFHSSTSQEKLAIETKFPPPEGQHDLCDETTEAGAFQSQYQLKACMGFLRFWLPHHSCGSKPSCHMVHTSRVSAAWQNWLTQVHCSYSMAMAAWTTLHKKLHTAKAAWHMCSRGPVVRSLPFRRLWSKPSCWGVSSAFSKKWWR